MKKLIIGVVLFIVGLIAVGIAITVPYQIGMTGVVWLCSTAAVLTRIGVDLIHEGNSDTEEEGEENW